MSLRSRNAKIKTFRDDSLATLETTVNTWLATSGEKELLDLQSGVGTIWDGATQLFEYVVVVVYLE